MENVQCEDCLQVKIVYRSIGTARRVYRVKVSFLGTNLRTYYKRTRKTYSYETCTYFTENFIVLNYTSCVVARVISL